MSVKVNFESTDEGVVKALEAMTKETQKLKQELKEMHQETKHGHEEAGHLMESFKEVATTAATMVLGFSSAEGMLEKLIETYKEMRKELEEVGEAHHEFSEGLIKDLAKIGLIKNLPKIEENIKEFVKGGGLREHYAGAVAGVTGAAPSMDFGRQQALAKEVAKFGGVGQDTRSFGGIAGSVANMFPQKSAQDVTSFASKLQSELGDGADEIGNPRFIRAVGDLQRAGMSKEDALGMAIQAKRQGLRADSLSSLSMGLTKTIQPHHGGRMTPDERLEQSMRGKSAEERLEAAKKDPALAKALFGEEVAFKIGGFGFEGAKKIGSELAGTTGRDAAAEMHHDLLKSGYGRAVLQGEGADSRKQTAGLSFESREDELAQAKKFVEAVPQDNFQGFWHRRIAMHGLLGMGGNSAKSQFPAAQMFAELNSMGGGVSGIGQDEVVSQLSRTSDPKASIAEYARLRGKAGGRSENPERAAQILEEMLKVLERIEGHSGEHATENVNTHTE